MQVNQTDILKQAATQISAHDPFLAQIIAQVGPCTLEPHNNHYQELVESIISQQLSVKAAATIWQRFLQLFGGAFPMPQEILAKHPDELRAAGLSRAKASYVQDIAMHIMDGRLEINKLPELSNQQIIAELTAIKGVGEWTAHMFLIFSLGRLDVLAVGDLGIRNGMMQLYQLPTLPDAQTMRSIAQKYHWHPYESVACWYVWQSLDKKLVSPMA